LWRGIEEGRSTEQLARDLAAEFAVDVTQAAQDLESFAVELRSMGLLVAA
jgi:adenylosuccinate lyase